MHIYDKFIKKILTKKKNKFIKENIIELEAESNAIIQKTLPPKLKDLRSFTILITVGNFSMGRALRALRASIKLMPLSMLSKVGEVKVKPTFMTLYLIDCSIKFFHWVVTNVLVKVEKFIFLVDFIIMDMKKDLQVSIILGRPFMMTTRVLIDVVDGKFKLEYEMKQ
uniref:Uncharacterized protein n=1 Tax=Cajanus cajan TaxID=3821 RepID=A0A151RXS9_CAJCA|nr:hypothetical protein KK1_031032 [Cajanus cajan]